MPARHTHVHTEETCSAFACSNACRRCWHTRVSECGIHDRCEGYRTWCPARARVSHAGVAAPSTSFFLRQASTARLLSAPLACKASSTTRSKQPCVPGSSTTAAVWGAKGAGSDVAQGAVPPCMGVYRPSCLGAPSKVTTAGVRCTRGTASQPAERSKLTSTANGSKWHGPTCQSCLQLEACGRCCWVGLHCCHQLTHQQCFWALGAGVQWTLLAPVRHCNITQHASSGTTSTERAQLTGRAGHCSTAPASRQAAVPLTECVVYCCVSTPLLTCQARVCWVDEVQVGAQSSHHLGHGTRQLSQYQHCHGQASI